MKKTQSVIKRTITHQGTVRLRSNADGTPSRTIEGYSILFDSPSAVLGRDSQGREIREIISPTAITKELLDQSDIVMTIGHDNSQLLARSRNGKGTLSYEIDDKGVRFRFDAPDTIDGDRAVELVPVGVIDGCSFCFSTDYYSPECVTREETSDMVIYRVIKVHAVHDFTLTPFPAYPDTSCSLLRDLEQQRGMNASLVDKVAQIRKISRRKTY